MKHPAAWARAIIITTVVVLGLALPTLFFDDAYITFRYAANIARGDGFTYNPPEHLLGVTTPLFTLLLAAAARLGCDIESAALMFGLIGHALLCLAVYEAALALKPEEDSGWWTFIPLMTALVCALHPHLALTAVGGMETSLYCALVLATLLAASRGAAAVTGVAAGLALLTRPDAVLMAPALAWLFRRAEDRAETMRVSQATEDSRLVSPGDSVPRDRAPHSGDLIRRLARAALWSAAVAGPWLVFAWWYFGSPIPQSIAAKRHIHPYGASQVLAEFIRFLLDDWYLLVALLLALGGAWVLRRRPMAQALGLFMIVYLIAYTLSGIEPFPWYANPLIPPCLLLAAAALMQAALKTPRRLRPVWGGALLVVAVVAALDLGRQLPGLREDWDAWEGGYEIAARWIMSDSRPGDSVYVGEVGVIGYLLRGRTIIDSSGINSMEVFRLRRGHTEEDADWSRQVVKTLSPDYITSSEKYIHIEDMAREGWFQLLYARASVPLLEDEGQVIYKRRRKG